MYIKHYVNHVAYRYSILEVFMEKIKSKGAIAEVFKDRLQLIMRNTSTTQIALAKAIGGSRQTVGQYEAGSALPVIDKLLKIAEFFEVSTDYLLGLSGVTSQNVDDKAIHEATGLSDRAIKELQLSWQTLKVEADSTEATPEYIHAENTINGINFLLEQGTLDPTRVLDYLADYRACDGREYIISSTDGKYAMTAAPTVLKQGYLNLIGKSIDGGIN